MISTDQQQIRRGRVTTVPVMSAIRDAVAEARNTSTRLNTGTETLSCCGGRVTTTSIIHREIERSGSCDVINYAKLIRTVPPGIRISVSISAGRRPITVSRRSPKRRRCRCSAIEAARCEQQRPVWRRLMIAAEKNMRTPALARKTRARLIGRSRLRYVRPGPLRLRIDSR